MSGSFIRLGKLSCVGTHDIAQEGRKTTASSTRKLLLATVGRKTAAAHCRKVVTNSNVDYYVHPPSPGSELRARDARELHTRYANPGHNLRRTDHGRVGRTINSAPGPGGPYHGAAVDIAA